MEYTKAFYLFEEEFILNDQEEPYGITFACITENGDLIDYGGSLIEYIDNVNWRKTLKHWGIDVDVKFNDLDFDIQVRTEFIRGGWKLIDKRQDEKIGE